MSTNTPLLDQLDEHDQALAEATARVRALKRDAAAGLDTAEQLKRQAIEAHSVADEEAVKRLRARRTKHETHRTEVEERLEGARLAAERASDNRAWFLREHVDAINAERLPDVQAGYEALKAWAAQGADLIDAVLSDARRSVDLLVPIDGRDGRDVPDNSPIAQAIRQLVSEVNATRLPMPEKRSPVRPLTIAEPPSDMPELAETA